ncbi:helix-turn-helix transcriptional regulator [Bradyrhizobium sp. 168]|uniref:XRE family transcriptional regulator n=1 Tax=Bradyrhizobium sp. 168 TaxID=2782639 RepID=UPI001FF82BE2|nr:XRE family transcriptional regulator [Bradyrhizobium sp. 168]MCK1585462.1 helix-turn-helix transcriptional regulator [Bradyrhizobium sp. 168]
MKAREAVPRILDATGWTQKELAKKIGVSQGTISKWMNETQSPNTKQWDGVLDLIRRDGRLTDLAQELEPSASADVVGQVGAGSKIDDFYDDEGGSTQVALPFPAFGEFISFEVLGDSMLPKYEPGEVVVVWKNQRRSTESFIGELCVVRLETGERYLKKLATGSRPGLYRLESFNSSPIVDAAVSWVGEVMATVPAKQVKKIVVAAPAQTKKKGKTGR